MNKQIYTIQEKNLNSAVDTAGKIFFGDKIIASVNTFFSAVRALYIFSQGGLYKFNKFLLKT